MSDTSGFYKLDKETAHLFFAPTMVAAPGFTLVSEHRTKYALPLDGWRWFDTVEEAAKYHGIPVPTVDDSAVEQYEIEAALRQADLAGNEPLAGEGLVLWFNKTAALVRGWATGQ